MRNGTLCFTGHRYYAGEPEDEKRLEDTLEAAYTDGYRRFISGVAEGFDLAAAEAVLKLREQWPDVRLTAAVPFRRQAAKFAPENKTRYETILAAADEVAMLAEKYDYGCYYRRDDWMTERSSRLVCWYDGSDGGTRYTVRSALKYRLDIVNIYRESGTLF